MVFSIFGWLSIIAIVSLILAHLVVGSIRATDEIPGRLKYLPFILLPVSYILMRLLFYYVPFEYDRSISLLMTIVISIIITFLLFKYKTNKFKSKIKMKQLKDLMVEDEARRNIKK